MYRAAAVSGGCRAILRASNRLCGHERSSPLALVAANWRTSPRCALPRAQNLFFGGGLQRREYAAKKQRVRGAVLVDSAITSDVVQLISLEGQNLGHVALADAKLLAKQKGLRLACLVPLANPPICRLQRITAVPTIDDEELAAEAAKEESAAIKRRPKGEKELRFSDAIAEHDVQNKVNQLRRFLEKGLRVRVSVYFKSVAQFDMDLARILLDNIVGRADDLARVEGDISVASRFASLLLIPLASSSSSSSASASSARPSSSSSSSSEASSAARTIPADQPSSSANSTNADADAGDDYDNLDDDDDDDEDDYDDLDDLADLLDEDSDQKKADEPPKRR